MPPSRPERHCPEAHPRGWEHHLLLCIRNTAASRAAGCPAKGLVSQGSSAGLGNVTPGLLVHRWEGAARGSGLLLCLEVQTGLPCAPRTGPFPVCSCQSPGRTWPVGLSPCFSTPGPGALDSGSSPMPRSHLKTRAGLTRVRRLSARAWCSHQAQSWGATGAGAPGIQHTATWWRC